MIVVNEVVKFDIDRNAVGGDQRFVAIGYNPRMLDGSEKIFFFQKTYPRLSGWPYDGSSPVH